MTMETTADLPLFSFAEKQAQAKNHKYSDVLTLLQAGYSIRHALRRLLIPRQTFYDCMAKDQQLRMLVNDLAPENKPGTKAGDQQERSYFSSPYDPRVQGQVRQLTSLLEQGYTLRKACDRSGISTYLVYKWKRQYKGFRQLISGIHQYDSSGVRKIEADESIGPNRIDVGLEGHYHLYIIKAEGCDLVKIGSSKVPSRRLVALQTGSPLMLTIDRYIVGAAIFEKNIHLDLTTRGLHSHGEWFHQSCIPFVMDYIKSHAKQLAS